MRKMMMMSVMALLVADVMSAQYYGKQTAGVVKDSNDALTPLSPAYMDNVSENGGWGANWFLSLKGGINAFAGTPSGCGDLTDRINPMLNISVGKWVSPRIGLRIGYQGLKVTDSSLNRIETANFHADIMYNIASHFRTNDISLPRWDIIPYIGAGWLKNCENLYKPFALSYGLMIQYRLHDRLHLSLELGNTTAWQDFDGVAENPAQFGDHMLQASLGLTLTIGKAGWKKVIDPRPYICQNDLLMERLGGMQKENDELTRAHMKDAMALAEMRKILEIEGLLDKYELVQLDSISTKKSPKGGYSGLNSLRARLRNKNWNGNIDEYPPVQAGRQTGGDSLNLDDYLHKMRDGSIYVGSPIFFFFKVATASLSEKAQVINIKEVASTITKYGMSVRVVGAADSQTGTAYTNEQLSIKRANYIAGQLMKYGVPEERITKQHRGGINSYEPNNGNRNTCVMLYFK